MKTSDKIPSHCVQGDTLYLLFAEDEYPAAEYTLVLSFVSPSSKLVVQGKASGLEHEIVVDTKSLAIGRNDWQLKAASVDYSKTIRSGRIEVQPDFASDNIEKLDNRSWLEQAIEALQSAIKGLAGKTQLKMEIDGMQIERMSLEEKINALKNLQLMQSVSGSASGSPSGSKTFKTIRPRFYN